MKKTQLMGRRKVANPKRNPKYPALHIHSLPYEILIAIFSHLSSDVQTLLLLSLTCSKFHNIVCKTFIYQDVFFKLTSHFLRFAAAHLSLRASLARRFGLNEPSSMINYIRKVHFVNPPTNDRESSLTKIAGTYSVENVNRGTLNYDDWVTSFKCLLNEAYGIKEVSICEISPQFEFPPEFMANPSLLSLKFTFRRQQPSRHLEKLTLTAQSGWTIPFKPSQMLLFAYVFDQIDELQLNKFVINEAKLSDAWEKKFVIDSFAASACIYSDVKKGGRRKSSHVFAYTRLLLLLDVQNGANLSLIDVVKLNGRLLRLVIDVGSKIFYSTEGAKGKSFNFSKFNNFFKLICSGQGGYCGLREVVLVNFDLFHDFGHQHENRPLDVIQEDSELVSHEDDVDSWVEPPTNTFQYFLRYLLQIPQLTIVVKEQPKVMHTCVKCGFTQEEVSKKVSSLLPHEWGIILAPVLCNPKCTVNIYDHAWTTLFSRKARVAQ